MFGLVFDGVVSQLKDVAVMTLQKTMSPDDRAFYKALGARMAMRREILGLTQAEMAAVLGVAQQTYASYEVGRYRAPASMLSQLADALDTDVNFLLGIHAKTQSKRGLGQRSSVKRSKDA